MYFSSSVFLFAFLPVVLLVYHLPLRGHRTAQNVFLLLASLFFYGWGAKETLLLMLGSIVMNHVLGLIAGRVRAKGGSLRPVVTVCAVLNLALLFVFKYLGFSFSVLRSFGISLPDVRIELPIGISFYTFQAMSYVFDVARGDAEAQKNPLCTGLYISFFPQLVAGPIVKYQTIAEELTSRRESWEDFSAGVSRFIAGLGKKVLIANQLAVIADAAFNASAPSAALAWLGAFAYTGQIYFDFSGYSDMAIGLGRMFGFHFLENFNYPYISRSVTEFWRRWHISLSGWFRDYLYIPLGGSRCGEGRNLLNLFVVWALTGLWHGAAWNFVLWGLFYFVLLVGERRLWGRRLDASPSLFRHCYAVIIIVFGWVLFRAAGLHGVLRYVAAMFGANGLYAPIAGFYLRENLPVLALAVLFSMPIAPKLRRWAENSRYAALWAVLLAVGLCGVLLISSAYLIRQTYNPFIYFRF